MSAETLPFDFATPIDSDLPPTIDGSDGEAASFGEAKKDGITSLLQSMLPSYSAATSSASTVTKDPTQLELYLCGRQPHPNSGSQEIGDHSAAWSIKLNELRFGVMEKEVPVLITHAMYGKSKISIPDALMLAGFYGYILALRGERTFTLEPGMYTAGEFAVYHLRYFGAMSPRSTEMCMFIASVLYATQGSNLAPEDRNLIVYFLRSLYDNPIIVGPIYERLMAEPFEATTLSQIQVFYQLIAIITRIHNDAMTILISGIICRFCESHPMKTECMQLRNLTVCLFLVTQIIYWNKEVYTYNRHSRVWLPNGKPLLGEFIILHTYHYICERIEAAPIPSAWKSGIMNSVRYLYNEQKSINVGASFTVQSEISPFAAANNVTHLRNGTLYMYIGLRQYIFVPTTAAELCADQASAFYLGSGFTDAVLFNIREYYNNYMAKLFPSYLEEDLSNPLRCYPSLFLRRVAQDAPYRRKTALAFLLNMHDTSNAPKSIFIAWGPKGDEGKSGFMKTFRLTLPKSEAYEVKDHTFVESGITNVNPEGHTDSLVRFGPPTKFLYGSEVAGSKGASGKGRFSTVLNTTMIKRVFAGGRASGDELNVRAAYGGTRTISPEVAGLLVTNNPPNMPERVTLADWKRIIFMGLISKFLTGRESYNPYRHEFQQDDFSERQQVDIASAMLEEAFTLLEDPTTNRDTFKYYLVRPTNVVIGYEGDPRAPTLRYERVMARCWTSIYMYRKWARSNGWVQVVIEMARHVVGEYDHDESQRAQKMDTSQVPSTTDSLIAMMLGGYSPASASASTASVNVRFTKECVVVLSKERHSRKLVDQVCTRMPNLYTTITWEDAIAEMEVVLNASEIWNETTYDGANLQLSFHVEPDENPWFISGKN